MDISASWTRTTNQIRISFVTEIPVMDVLTGKGKCGPGKTMTIMTGTVCEMTTFEIIMSILMFFQTIYIMGIYASIRRK